MTIRNSTTTKMETLPLDVIETLERSIKAICPKVMIHEIDYERGTVTVAYIYNIGTFDEWIDENFLVVNVAHDSTAAAFKDVFNAVYERCI